MFIIPYASRTGTLRNLAGLRARGWRLLVSASGRHSHEGFEHFGIDNGAWSVYAQWIAGGCVGPAPFLDKRQFIRLMLALGAGADFAVAPDQVAGGIASLELSLRWIPWMLKHTPKVLLAVQDGMTVEQIRPYIGRDVGIFVGGSTDGPRPWKLATLTSWCDLARERGAWCHVGRVNSVKRIRLCQQGGATSFDGTSATRYAIKQPVLNRPVAQGTLLPTAPPERKC